MTQSISVSFQANPLVSVIMNGYNCSKYLRQAIDSVFSQNYQHWEIIFWDNASTDSTQLIANSYGPKLHYFRSDRNTTLGVARNSALQRVSGEFIAFLDTDDFWLPDKLAIQVSLMQKMNDVDFIYSNFYFLDQDSIRLRQGLRRAQASGNVFGRFLEYYPVNLQTVLMRCSALTRLDHFFDEKFCVSEEFDMFMRVLYESQAYYLDKVTAVYRIHDTMNSLKSIDLFSLEGSLCLAKLLALYPDIEYSFAKEISIFKEKIAFYHARALIYRHNSSEARRVLSQYLFKSFVLSVLFLASYSSVLWKFLLYMKFRFL